MMGNGVTEVTLKNNIIHKVSVSMIQWRYILILCGYVIIYFLSFGSKPDKWVVNSPLTNIADSLVVDSCSRHSVDKHEPD